MMKARRGGDLYSEQLDIMKLFELSYISGPFGDDPAEVSLATPQPNPTGEEFLIIVKNIVGKSTTLCFKSTLATTSVRDLKRAIQAEEEIPVSNQRLLFASEPLQEDLSPHKWSGHKWSGGTIYVQHNWSGRTTYVVINGPPGPLMLKHKWSY